MKKGLCSIFILLLLAGLLSGPALAETDPPGDLTVPVLSVATEGGSGCTLEKSDGTVSALLTVTDVDGSETSDVIHLKVRGNTTALSWIEKKSFTLKFTEEKDLLGLGKGKKWVLVSNVFDPTLLRNALAFETAEEMGLAYTSRYRFVELRLDGSFRGSYILFEPVQQGPDRVAIDCESNGGMQDFLVEYETETAMQDPDAVYFTAAGHRFIASAPKKPNEDQLSYMQEILSDIILTLENGTEEQIAEKADLPSFVKYYLLNEYFKTYDFGVTSVFFYYQGGKLHAGPPWDYDLSMGNANSELAGRCRSAASSQGMFADKNLFASLAHRSWFRELVKAEYEAHYDFFSRLSADGGVLDALRAANRNPPDGGSTFSAGRTGRMRKTTAL